MNSAEYAPVSGWSAVVSIPPGGGGGGRRPWEGDGHGGGGGGFQALMIPYLLPDFLLKAKPCVPSTNTLKAETFIPVSQ